MVRWKIAFVGGFAALGSFLFLRMVGLQLDLHRERIDDQKRAEDEQKQKDEMLTVTAAPPIDLHSP